MYEIDRMVAILTPTKNFLDWVNTHKEQDDDVFSLEELQEDSTAILIPIFESKSEADDYVESICSTLFENELSAWTLDEDTWPEPISAALFNEWFSVSYHSLVIDSVETDAVLAVEEDVPTTIQ